MALAQTVAGVRQYTVLISLMDNWDSMKNNLNVAANAKGELQAQQDIYDQSWAAAKKRLKSTTAEVYNNLVVLAALMQFFLLLVLCLWELLEITLLEY